MLSKESFLARIGVFGIVMEETTSTGTADGFSPVRNPRQVTDFYTLNDGLLGVTVLGLERFCIHEMETDDAGLRHAGRAVAQLAECGF